MCIMAAPMALMAIASFAVSAVSAVAQYQQGKQAAKAQDTANRANYEQSMVTANEQQRQINAKSADEMYDRARQALIDRGRLRAASGESGVMGNSLDRITNEQYFVYGSDIASIEANRSNAINQSQLEKQGIRANIQGRINTTERPSKLGTGLQIAGAALNAYGGYQSDIAQTKAKTPARKTSTAS